ncbi:1,4-Dihydroxy-2-naphthoyl-CoA synthase [Desulfotomaculum arcticum]|uniref:1,4-dihydroxy-2-naphthoyl-CoA synthase n=1 Tax=Desulfotruncus arcticus DSM 17038 TaxID=1121424 RepID=A0A1I2UUI5_9FIRM|nr:1,4-dihydroxy-2-naphthoyl-CoA synthase [Desulfotruncus arcticus]SFG80814.1 1,4-Dihydroxy-2-naphthoyl-CoA synthase [Desulfotomaculum arcticum] [Desulfotruncus arcticus DSM 17038]
MKFQDILYTKYDGKARVTINRPNKLNAFTNQTLQEMISALLDAWTDKNIGVIIITGAGDRAFSVGGDQSIRSKDGYATSNSEKSGLEGLENLPLANNHAMLLQIIRTIPKPVVAMVNGYAIGGGHVIHVVCDLSVASEKAKFGQVGPRVGSFDAGYGSAYLARIVGEKKAREIWYLCQQYTAEDALKMGLVNKVVPPENLEEEVEKMCDTLLSHSPTALAALKASFNADTEAIWGIHSIAGIALNLYYGTDEAMEGRNAFMEKRKPDFSKFRK